MTSTRHKTRRMFRRLSWVIGVLFAFIGGVVLAIIIVSSPELTSSGTVAEVGNPTTSSSGGTFSGFSGVVLWTVATSMCFGVGFMMMRVSGWLVLSLIPHSQRHRAPSADEADDGYDDYEESDEYVDDHPIEDDDDRPATAEITSHQDLEPPAEQATEDRSGNDQIEELAPPMCTETESPAEVESMPPSVKTSQIRRRRIKFGRGVRSAVGHTSITKPRFRRGPD